MQKPRSPRPLNNLCSSTRDQKRHTGQMANSPGLTRAEAGREEPDNLLACSPSSKQTSPGIPAATQ